MVLPDGRRGVVIRVYGVSDDPKANAADATWFGRPLLEALAALGLAAEAVWPGIDPASRSLWNAGLFPVGTPDQAWACACWMMGLGEAFSIEQWKQMERLSLATSAQWVDNSALADLRLRRLYGNWQTAAISLAQSGSDLRPLLAHAPGLRLLATTGQALCSQGREAETAAPTQAASVYVQASLFLQQAGLEEEAGRAQDAAFKCVERAVEAGVKAKGGALAVQPWLHQAVTVRAPARVDLGGGWSDTPPFCLDWGGTVLNAAVTLNGKYPICTSIRRLDEPILRFVSEDTLEQVEYHAADELQSTTPATGTFNIHRTALRMMGIGVANQSLAAALKALGGGLEVRTAVTLPLGSGLGTSSILSATVIRALAEMGGIKLSNAELLDQVMQLEQRMTTGGGWQDQVGGVYPGVKLGMSGPGLRQRIRVEPLDWSTEQGVRFQGSVCSLLHGNPAPGEESAGADRAQLPGAGGLDHPSPAQPQDACHGNGLRHARRRMGLPGAVAGPALAPEPGARSQHHECADQRAPARAAALAGRGQAGGRGWRRIPDAAGEESGSGAHAARQAGTRRFAGKPARVRYCPAGVAHRGCLM